MYLSEEFVYKNALEQKVLFQDIIFDNIPEFITWIATAGESHTRKYLRSRIGSRGPRANEAGKKGGEAEAGTK